MNVQRLATLWQKHAASLGQREHIEIFDEKRVGLTLVEGDLLSLPPLMPKICIHSS